MHAVAPTCSIAPRRGVRRIDLHELWAYRELLFFFVWRDVKVRYRQTVLGAAWAVLQPVAAMVVFSLVFGRFVGVPSDGVPYPLFSFAGLVPWTFFAAALGGAVAGVVGSANLVRKIYFPKLLLPASTVVGGLVDLALAFGVLLLLMAYFGHMPGWPVVLVPAIVALAVATALGAGFVLAALNVRFRDVQFTMPLLTQLWLFATPVAYPASVVPEPWRTVMALNPMFGVVEGMRWALLGTTAAPVGALLMAAMVAATMLVTGAILFRQAEGTLADLV